METPTPAVEPRRSFLTIFLAQFKAFREEGNSPRRSLAYAILFALDGVDVMDVDAIAQMHMDPFTIELD